MKEFDFMCKAFTGEGVVLHKIQVDEFDTIRVYDSCAKKFTAYHAINKINKLKILNFANSLKE
jgi:hypothetical protein